MTSAIHPTNRDDLPLARRVAVGADAAAVAQAVVEAWREAQTALQPVIGPRGVLALFNRSVHLASGLHPWLADAGQEGTTMLDPSALRGLFAQQGAAQALAGGNHVLQVFQQLLATLIGPALTQRLLQPAPGLPTSELPSGQAPP